MEENKLLRIGEVSKLLDISIQSIRHYEKVGLISPSYIDPSNAYRYFDRSEVSKLWGIVILKSADFSLKEISDISSLDLEDVYEIMQDKQSKIRHKIEMEKIALNYINRNLKAIRSITNDEDLEGEYKYIERRYGKCIDTSDDRSFEEHYKKLKELKGIYGLNQEVVYQPSRMIDISLARQYKLKNLFAINTNEFEYSPTDTFQEKGLYYCKIVPMKKDKDDYYKEIIEKIESDGYRLRGDSLEIILIDDSLARNVETFVCEFQIAVIEK